MRIRRRVVAAEIPTASMADVAFLLIIFFLVTSVFSVTRGIQFSLPRHDEAALSAEPEAAVLIRIAADGSLLVDDTPMRLDEVRASIEPRVRRNPTKSVIVQTSPEAPYAAMTDVFDELRQAGVANVILPTQSQLATYGLGETR